MDRINGNTPNGSMLVAVAGLMRTANAEYIWKALSNPVSSWLQWVVQAVTGKLPQGQTKWEDLPEWFKQLPDSKLMQGQNYSR